MNEDVLISKINESSVKIFCPQFIGHKIRDNYKFFAPGYKYSPKYKNPERPWQKGRHWDGKVSLLDLRDRLFPYGLLNNLTEFLDRENITYAFDFSTALDKDYRIHDNFMQLFYKEIFKDTSFYPRDYQHEAIRNLLYNKRGVVEEATGCHIAGTEILMSNGSVKKVEDISVDDKLMGKNGDVRTVLSLISGVGQLYKITPCSGDSFIVNGDHVLHLQYTNKSNSVVHKKAFTFIDISVNDYLKKSKTFDVRRRQRYEAELVEIIRKRLLSFIFDENKLKGKVDCCIDQISKKQLDPYTAADEILGTMLK